MIVTVIVVVVVIASVIVTGIVNVSVTDSKQWKKPTNNRHVPTNHYNKQLSANKQPTVGSRTSNKPTN